MQAWTGGWWNYDPTNDAEINEQYISVGVGRDYSDVTPAQGHLLRGGFHRPRRRRGDHPAGLRVGTATAAERSVARVHVRRETLAFCQRAEQPPQVVALVVIESCGEAAVVLARQVADLAHQLLARRGQIEGMQAPVLGVAAAFDIAAVLEVVDVGDDAAG